MSTLSDLTVAEIAARMAADGLPAAHAVTLFRRLHGDVSGDLSTPALPRPLVRWLDAQAAPLAPALAVIRESTSDDHRTTKWLLRLVDGQDIETVMMGYPGRRTACLSTQAGCAMGCVFCATGQMGFVRNLTPGEIVAQALFVARRVRESGGDRLRNLVLMGMGEPLANFETVMQALAIIADPRGLNIGPARVSISTAGHVPGIRRLAVQPQRYRLVVSLHAATDEERSALVPINRRWPIAELMDACREYAARQQRRILIAWTLIAARNDRADDAHRLVSLLRGMDVQVNLIPLNLTVGYAGATSSTTDVHAFQRILLHAGVPATIRQRRGIDVAAGCGQLAGQR
jgi:23S rRNA (adenine2503-C2)-methyltransferase